MRTILRNQTFGQEIIIEWLYSVIALNLDFRDFCVKLMTSNRMMATMKGKWMSCHDRACSTPLFSMVCKTCTMELAICGPTSAMVLVAKHSVLTWTWWPHRKSEI